MDTLSGVSAAAANLAADHGPAPAAGKLGLILTGSAAVGGCPRGGVLETPVLSPNQGSLA